MSTLRDLIAEGRLLTAQTQRWRDLDVQEMTGAGNVGSGSSTGTMGVMGATTGANVGAYQVPLGGMFRRTFPGTVSFRKRRRH